MYFVLLLPEKETEFVCVCVSEKEGKSAKSTFYGKMFVSNYFI